MNYKIYELPKYFEMCTSLKDNFIQDDGYIFCNLEGFGMVNRYEYKLTTNKKLNISRQYRKRSDKPRTELIT